MPVRPRILPLLVDLLLPVRLVLALLLLQVVLALALFALDVVTLLLLGGDGGLF